MLSYIIVSVCELKPVLIVRPVFGRTRVGQEGVGNDSHALTFRSFERKPERRSAGVRHVEQSTTAALQGATDKLDERSTLGSGHSVEAGIAVGHGWKCAVAAALLKPSRNY